MSFDVWLAIDTGGLESAMVAEVGNVTYNLSPMFVRALGVPEKPRVREDGSAVMAWYPGTQEWKQSVAGGLRALDGAPCTEAGGVVARAVQRMESEPGIYRAMNPPNGWGDYEGALDFMRRLAAACAEHPKATVRVG